MPANTLPAAPARVSPWFRQSLRSAPPCRCFPRPAIAKQPYDRPAVCPVASAGRLTAASESPRFVASAALRASAPARSPSHSDRCGAPAGPAPAADDTDSSACGGRRTCRRPSPPGRARPGAAAFRLPHAAARRRRSTASSPATPERSRRPPGGGAREPRVRLPQAGSLVKGDRATRRVRRRPPRARSSPTIATALRAAGAAAAPDSASPAVPLRSRPAPRAYAGRRLLPLVPIGAELLRGPARGRSGRSARGRRLRPAFGPNVDTEAQRPR